MVTTFAFILLFITVWFDGVPAHCLVDTGAQVTLLRESVAVSMGTLGPPSFDRLTVVQNVRPVQGYWRYATRVGTQHFGWDGGWIGVFPDEQLGWPCVLGVDFLGRQPITLDWQNQEVLPGEGTRNHG